MTELTDEAREAAVKAMYGAMEAYNQPRAGKPLALIPPSLRPALVDAAVQALVDLGWTITPPGQAVDATAPYCTADETYGGLTTLPMVCSRPLDADLRCSHHGDQSAVWGPGGKRASAHRIAEEPHQ